MPTINVNWVDINDKLPDEEDYYWVTIFNIIDGSLRVDGDWFVIDTDSKFKDWDAYSNEYSLDKEEYVVAWAEVNKPEPMFNSKFEQRWDEYLGTELEIETESDITSMFNEFEEWRNNHPKPSRSKRKFSL